MGDVASLAVGLHLNAANFKSQLMSAYGSAESQSRQFNRNAQADAKKTEDAYKRVSASVSGLAGRLAGFAGAGLSLGAIINTTRQYSQSLSDLQAITGATSAQMKLYDQAAQEMGRTTEYSASQAAEAIKLMASAKPELLSTSAGLTAATKSALTLAQAAGTTLPDATRTLALSLNQFGAGASEADRYINVLAAGAKFGSSEIADTAAAIKNGGVAAAQAGVGFETLNAAIQVLAEREVKGGEAGTALRNVILNLEKGTDKTLKPSVVGLSQALENLAGKNQSTKQAVKLFGVENLSAASILVQNREKVESLTAALTGTQTAHEQAEIRVNNLNGDLLSLTSAFEGLIIKVGQSGNGPLRSGVQTVTDAINGLTDNFNTVANVALYTLIPVLATKLTAGIRGNIGAWVEQQQAVRASAMAQADMARKTLESTAATLAQNNAEFGRYREMEKSARQFGLNVSYQSEFNRLIRQETEQTLLSTQAKSQLNAANKQLSVSARAASAAVGMARGALALVGGPVGAAMLAGSALLYFHNQAKNARQSAIDLKNAVVETNEELKKLSLNQLNVKQLDIDEQFENQVIQRNKLIKEIQDADSRIDGLSGFDPFGQLKGVQNDKTRYKGDLDAVEQGLKLLKERQKIVKEAIEQAKSGKTDPSPKPDTEEGKLSQFLVAADRIAFINPANGNETPMFVAQGNQIFMNEVFLKYLTAPSITSGGNPPTFMLTPDGRLTARNADISGNISANSGTLNNVTIAENCTINGTMRAENIVGDIVKAVGRAFPGSANYPNGTLTVQIQDDHHFDRQIIIPPITFAGGKAKSETSNEIWTDCGLLVKHNGREIYNAEPAITARSFSRVLDMPAGGGNVTLSFTVSSRGYGGGAWADISNLLVMVVKKNSTGISIY